MKIIHAANKLGNGSRKVCLAIGVFDGVLPAQAMRMRSWAEATLMKVTLRIRKAINEAKRRIKFS